MRLYYLIVICCLASVTVEAASKPVVRVFRDWRVECVRDQPSCTMTTAAKWSKYKRSKMYQLKIHKHQLNQPLELSFVNKSNGIEAGSSLVFVTDQKEAINVNYPEEIKPLGDASFYTVLTRDTADELIDNMILGKRIVVNFINESNKTKQLLFSLLGVTASIRFIDQHQSQFSINSTNKDWSANFIDLFPAIHTCLGQTKNHASVYSAWTLGNGKAGVLVKNQDGAFFECQVPVLGAQVEKYNAVDDIRGFPLGPIFTPSHYPVSAFCGKHLRATDITGQYVGWLTYAGCE
ncbi:hypothetical protein [Spartinivicinus poritis]|uniref:Uncharacterized protein n=1 Tax=Spartinivicinus poritis TaxID=2994640 RepID=A0ABT5UFU2_9GAMM|nr:hypothetical protein [Spartinivicinus sp. A2-2]MDE1465060.1 hypothetical protein [Spartinivicinus sp. A2-2]